MIIVLKANRSKEQVKNFISDLTDRYDVSVNTWVGTHSTVLGLIGDTAAVDSEYIAAQDIVESVKRVQEPYKKANRKFHPEDTVIKLPTGQLHRCPVSARPKAELQALLKAIFPE